MPIPIEDARNGIDENSRRIIDHINQNNHQAHTVNDISESLNIDINYAGNILLWLWFKQEINSNVTPNGIVYYSKYL